MADQALTDIATGSIKRLIVEMPPRHGKSELVSKYFPAWFLGTYQERKVILCSYGEDLAGDFGFAARQLIDEYGPAYFGVSVDQAKAARSDWKLLNRSGGMVSAGVGGPITGKGADLLIIDDYCKNAEEAVSESWRRKMLAWWRSTARPRLEPDAAAVVMATRWHKDDLIGELLRGEEEWTHIRLPAIADEHDQLGRKPGQPLWPQRWPLRALEQTRLTLGPTWWQALYQQRPTAHEGAEWPASYFADTIWTHDWPDEFEISALAIDPSKGRDTGDYSAIVFVGLAGGRWYVDATVRRRPVTQIVRDGLASYATNRPHFVGCESNQFQELLAVEFQRQITASRLPPMHVELIDNRQNKLLRIAKLGSYLEQGLFRFANTSDNRILVQQLQEFPLGDHDDGPDALEMALRLVSDQQFIEYDDSDLLPGRIL